MYNVRNHTPAEHNYGGLCQPELLELGEDSAELLIRIAERGIVGSSLFHHLPIWESDIWVAKVGDSHLFVGEIRVLAHRPEVEPGVVWHFFRGESIVR